MLNRRQLLIGAAATPVLLSAGVGVRAQTEKRIKLGAFGPETGPNAISYASIQGSSAYLKMVNDAGGIEGYTFDYIVVDDQTNPALTVSAARRLVEQEQVFALVNSIGTASNLAVKNYLESKKIPNVGLAVSTRAAGPYNYIVSPDYTNEGAFQAKFAIEKLATDGKLAIIYQNDDIGKAYLKGAEYIAKQTGGVELIAVPFQPSTIDFTPAVATAQKSGASVVIMSGTPNFFAPVVKAAEGIAFRPQWLAASYHASPTVLRELSGEQTKNMHFVTYTAIPGTPDSAEMEAALKKYYPDSKASFLTTLGWSGASVFGEAFRRMVKAGHEPSQEALVASLNEFVGYTNSIIRNISYKAGPGIENPHIPRPHEAVMKWTGEGFELVSDFSEVPKVPGQPGQ